MRRRPHFSRPTCDLWQTWDPCWRLMRYVPFSHCIFGRARRTIESKPFQSKTSGLIGFNKASPALQVLLTSPRKKPLIALIFICSASMRTVPPSSAARAAAARLAPRRRARETCHLFIDRLELRRLGLRLPELERGLATAILDSFEVVFVAIVTALGY